MKGTLVLAGLVLGLSSCGGVVGSLLPDSLPLASVGMSMPDPSFTGDGVIYWQQDLYPVSNTLVDKMIDQWPTPHVAGDLAYTNVGGNVSRLDIYLRPNMSGCAPVRNSVAFTCPVGGEASNLLGSAAVTSAAWTPVGPWAGVAVQQALQARHMYLGLKVTGGTFSATDQLNFNVKLTKN